MCPGTVGFSEAQTDLCPLRSRGVYSTCFFVRAFCQVLPLDNISKCRAILPLDDPESRAARAAAAASQPTSEVSLHHPVIGGCHGLPGTVTALALGKKASSQPGSKSPGPLLRYVPPKPPCRLRHCLWKRFTPVSVDTLCAHGSRHKHIMQERSIQYCFAALGYGKRLTVLLTGHTTCPGVKRSLR